MTPAEIVSWTMILFTRRMDALQICAQRMPKATPQELTREADRLIAWASQQSEPKGPQQ